MSAVERRLQNLVGVVENDARELARAAVEGAVDQALEIAAGAGATPTTVTGLEANRAFYICRRANRILRQREVEVLFRTTPGRARSILSTMTATYAEALADQFAARVREDVAIERTGSEADGYSWTLTFSEPSTYQLALDHLQVRGLRSTIQRTVASQRRIVLDYRTNMDGREVDPIDYLGWRYDG